jgi:hypothetical membrane protein
LAAQGPSRKQNSYRRRSGTLLLSSGTTFLIFNTIAEASYPNYSVRTNALSDLGAVGAPTRFFWDGQLFVVGVLAFLGMYFLFIKNGWPAPISRSRLTAAIFLLPAVGTIIVSLFPENFVLGVHGLGALTAFVFGGVSEIYAYRMTKSPFRYFSAILGMVTFTAIVLLGTATTMFGFGLIERMIVYPLFIWEIALGSYLMALPAA